MRVVSVVALFVVVSVPVCFCELVEATSVTVWVADSDESVVADALVDESEGTDSDELKPKVADAAEVALSVEDDVVPENALVVDDDSSPDIILPYSRADVPDDVVLSVWDMVWVDDDNGV